MSRGRAPIENRSGKTDVAHTGKLLRALIRSGKSFSGRERHCCFLNTGTAPFANVSAISGLDLPDDGRAIAQVDWDFDGDLDYWIVNRSGPQLRFMRNSLKNSNDFLSIQLKGNTSNRDAIGARVTVHLGDRVLLRSLRAGDGYLSQSSKWLHFGLGEDAQIEAVRVRWPDLTSEEVTHLEPGRRYTIVQGEGRAHVWNKTARTTNAQPLDASRSDPNRIVITSPRRMPRLEYESLAGDVVSEFEPNQRARPLLLSLWASWCQPCVEELGELTDCRDQLRRAGLDVLALNVDRISGQGEGQPQDSGKTVLRRLDFPFRSATATVKLLDQLQTVHDSLFDLHETLPLPCSFLVDTSNRLAVLYKGRVDAQELCGDVEQLGIQGRQRRDIASPLSGRWASPVRRERLMMFALKMLENAWLEETLSYIDQQREALAADPEYHVLLFNLGQEFTRRGNHARAMHFYQQALERKPDLGPAHYNLGVTLALAERLEDAAAHFQSAVDAEPNAIGNHISLATTLVRLGRLSDASGSLQTALQLHPENSELLYERGVVLVLRGKFNEGLQHYRQAITGNPSEFSKSIRFDRFGRSVSYLTQALEKRGDAGIASARVVRRRMEEFSREHGLGPLND